MAALVRRVLSRPSSMGASAHAPRCRGNTAPLSTATALGESLRRSAAPRRMTPFPQAQCILVRRLSLRAEERRVDECERLGDAWLFALKDSLEGASLSRDWFFKKESCSQQRAVFNQPAHVQFRPYQMSPASLGGDLGREVMGGTEGAEQTPVGFRCESVMKKRRKKMNKHKLKKRRKRDRQKNKP